jgi:gamma-polyglutamate biosynthesis protein CapA
MPDNQPLRIAFLGDIFCAATPYRVERGLVARFHRHRGAPWEDFLHTVCANADEVIGNLESPLVRDESLANREAFTGSTEMIRFLKKCGLTGVSVANNHILERGTAGFHETMDILKEIPLKTTGWMENGEPHVEVVDLKGLQVGLAGFNAISDLPNPGLHCDFTPENVYGVLNRMRDLDFRVIILHWGCEYTPFPSPAQIRLAREIVDHGADVVIGHHPHVLHPFEKHGRGLIFYSLGNFIFDLDFSRAVRIGLIPIIRFERGKTPDFDLTFFERRPDYTFRTLPPLPLRRRLAARMIRAVKFDDDAYAALHRRVHTLNRLQMLRFNLTRLFAMTTGARKAFLSRLTQRTPRKRA